MVQEPIEMHNAPLRAARASAATLTCLLMLSLQNTGCASRSVKPDAEEVKVSREAPSSKCRELGKVTGTTQSIKGSSDEALNDLKKDAARKGANFVVVKQYSDNETSVTGIAYECP